MGDLFQQGPSRAQRRAEFFKRANQLDIKNQSFVNVMELAQETGAQDPVAAAEDFFKKDKSYRDRLEKLLPKTDVPESTVPATQQVIDLLRMAGLPISGLEEPIPLEAPFGMNRATGKPLSVQELLNIVPIKSLPGPIVKSQPELSLFGPEAVSALPRRPVAGASTPTSLVTQAGQKVGVDKTALPSVGQDREAISLELYLVPFGQLDQRKRNNVNRIVDQREIRQRAATGAGAEIAKLNIELRKQRGKVSEVVKNINRVQDKIQSSPAVVGAPGALSRVITSLADQSKAMVDLIVPGAYEEFHKVERYANIFRETGIKSASLQSQLLGLSIAMALAEGFEGRSITDRKIELNLKRLTGAIGSGSADVAFNVLEHLKQELVEGFNTAASSTGTVEDVLGAVPTVGRPEKRIFIPAPDSKGKPKFEIMGREPAE